MAMPKPQVNKSSDGTMVFTNNFKAYEHTIKELVRAANKDILKIIRTETRNRMRKNKGSGVRALQGWNRKDGSLQIGYRLGVKGFYSSFFELGTKKLNGGNYQDASLIITVEANFENIRKIYSHYLKSYLPNIGMAEQVIDESGVLDED